MRDFQENEYLLKFTLVMAGYQWKRGDYFTTQQPEYTDMRHSFRKSFHSLLIIQRIGLLIKEMLLFSENHLWVVSTLHPADLSPVSAAALLSGKKQNILFPSISTKQ